MEIGEPERRLWVEPLEEPIPAPREVDDGGERETVEVEAGDVAEPAAA